MAKTTPTPPLSQRASQADVLSEIPTVSTAEPLAVAPNATAPATFPNPVPRFGKQPGENPSTPQTVPSLRDALITAGIELLAEGGIANLTLRRAAARAGVSHAAPAHHFDGLPGLLTAIAARAFQTFADTLHHAREAAGEEPTARLNGTCQGYLTFATTHSGLFHLMFISPEVNRGDPSLTPNATRAYQILREACAPLAQTEPDEALEVAVWSLVHGYAALGFTTDDPNRRPFTRLPPFAELLANLLGTWQNLLAPLSDMR